MYIRFQQYTTVSWCFTFAIDFMKISQTVFNLESRYKYMVEMAMCNVLRAITPKVDKSELRIMCSALCLMVLYICVKFRENIKNGIRVIEWTPVHGRNGYFQYL